MFSKFLKIFFFGLLINLIFAKNIFSQNDTIKNPIVNFKIGVGNWGLAFATEINPLKKVSIEGGVMSMLFINRISFGLKYQVFNKKSFSIKAGGEYSVARFTFLEKNKSHTVPIIGIPIEVIYMTKHYKKLSFQIQPAFLIESKVSKEFEMINAISYIFAF